MNSIIPESYLYLVKDIPGYTPQISRLMCMMNYARYVTLKSVEELTVKQLDFQLDEKSNSIGALLLHIAATDFYFRLFSVYGGEPDAGELKGWEAPLDLGKKGREEIKGNELSNYIKKLDETRSMTYEMFKTKNDEWLEREFQFLDIMSSNYHHLWFHVFEDEINHRGQINFIKKRLTL